MQQIGDKTARLFKLLAGQDRDEPVSSYVVGLYSFLFLVGMILFFAWLTNVPAACAAQAGC